MEDVSSGPNHKLTTFHRELLDLLPLNINEDNARKLRLFRHLILLFEALE